MDIHLPVRNFFQLHRTNSRVENTCGVCLVDFDPHEEVRVTLCNHIIHRDCIDAWLNKSRTCPFCRQELDETAVKKWFDDSANSQKYKHALRDMEVRRQKSLAIDHNMNHDRPSESNLDSRQQFGNRDDFEYPNLNQVEGGNE